MEDHQFKKTLDKAVQQTKEFAEEIHLKENAGIAFEKTKEVVGAVGKKITELGQDEAFKAKLKDVATPVVDTSKKVFEKLEENENVQKVFETVKQGTTEAVEFASQKTKEFLDKPEVQEKIEKAKEKTIELAESGVENLKKWLKPSDEENSSDEGKQ